MHDIGPPSFVFFRVFHESTVTMKNLIFLSLFVAVQPASAIEVSLVLLPRATDGTVFTLGKTYSGRSGGGFYRPDMLRYYISGITVHHDGTSTFLQDHYLLVDISKTDRYSLGDLDVNRVDSITFNIGVDIAHNHLDPATYPDWHPLAYQDPSMHWGWQSGYRFVTYEGVSGTSPDKMSAMMQIHTVDNSLYTPVVVRAGSTRTEAGVDIPVLANYEYLLESIDISRGLINHSAEGEAITLMRNMAQRVYTGAVVSSVQEGGNVSALAPNPASDVIAVPDGVRRVDVVDMQGATVASAELGDGATLVSVQHLAQGIYGVVMHHSHGQTSHATLAISR